MKNNKLSVIIPTLDRPVDIIAALNSIFEQSILPYELIIVDQSHSKQTFNSVNELFSKISPPTKLIYIHDSSFRGLVAAKKIGVERSTGEIISFLEDDETLNSDYFKNILHIFDKQDNIYGISGIVTNIRRHYFYTLAFKIFHRGIFFDNRIDAINQFQESGSGSIYTNHISGGISSYRKHVFEKIKYDLKNDFFYCEDIDFSIRASNYFGKEHFILAFNVGLEHHLSQINRDSMVPRWTRKTREFITIYKKNGNNFFDLASVIWLIIGLLFEAVYSSIIRQSFSPLKGYFKGLFQGVLNKLIVDSNIDHETVKGFGEEWEYFDQSSLGSIEKNLIFNDYFDIFPWDDLPENSTGFDLGCGSGRWAQIVADRVGHLNCIDPSVKALEVAKRNLSSFANVDFMLASANLIPVKDSSQDFGYSLGVLHHIPNTVSALKSSAKKLKSGAPFLVYLYYSFENRSKWYGLLWKLTDIVRKVIYILPEKLKRLVTDLIALVLYYPLAKITNLFEFFKIKSDSIPLSYYKDKSFYTMRTDARDRFGTSLEKRFTKKQIQDMMLEAGFENIKFSKSAPYWCAVGTKK